MTLTWDSEELSPAWKRVCLGHVWGNSGLSLFLLILDTASKESVSFSFSHDN